MRLFLFYVLEKIKICCLYTMLLVDLYQKIVNK